ncbi:MAG TPA: VOC family protein [Jatrophihabitans sp.]|jgi:catechol 2,3-dioxygenase-like lactoylglutathione lyase family enzyme
MPLSTSLDHITIVTDDFEASRPVYDAVLGALGLSPTIDYEDPEGEPEDNDTVAAIGYGTSSQRTIVWLVAGLSPTSGAHVALAVDSRDQVILACQAATDAGAQVKQPPRDWESDQLNYYGTQIADSNGNILEVITRGGH